MMRRILLIVYLSVLIMSIAGCGSRAITESFLREEVDFAFVEKVAVLPFENNSGVRYAAERTRDITITQVLAWGLYDTVEKGLVDNVLYEEAIDPGTPLDPLAMKRIGQRLRVQAFIVGTIDLAGSGTRMTSSTILQHQFADVGV